MLFLIVVMMYTPVFAKSEDRPDLVLKLLVEKEIIVEDKEGNKRTEWQEVKNTDPGDVLRYTIHYINKGNAEARNVVIVDPIPEGTSYISNSAEGKDSEITFSLDGKTFQTPSMLKYKVKQADGTEVEYVATPEMYTHIRWKLLKPVLPGSSGNLSFKVKVK
jgi:uncharacterized repeat protein (TIGR01451 family)